MWARCGFPPNAGTARLSVLGTSPRQDAPRGIALGKVAADPPSGRAEGAFIVAMPVSPPPLVSASYSVFSERHDILFPLFCLQGYPREPPSLSCSCGPHVLVRPLWLPPSARAVGCLLNCSRAVLQLMSEGSECGNSLAARTHTTPHARG